MPKGQLLRKRTFSFNPVCSKDCGPRLSQCESPPYIPADPCSRWLEDLPTMPVPKVLEWDKRADTAVGGHVSVDIMDWADCAIPSVCICRGNELKQVQMREISELHWVQKKGAPRLWDPLGVPLKAPPVVRLAQKEDEDSIGDRASCLRLRIWIEEGRMLF